MGRVFTVDVDNFFFDILIQYIFSEYTEKEIFELKIILPCKRDVIMLLNAFKNFGTKRCIILPEIISLEDIVENDLILNLDNVKVIKRTKRILLLIQFILEWNKKNNDNLPVDLAYKLSLLLDKVQHTQMLNYCQSDEYSKNMRNFINSFVKMWDNLLKDLEVVDILKHESDSINNMIGSFQKDQHIIFVGIGKSTIHKSLIKAIYELPFGKIIFPNLNFKIKEKDWEFLSKNHYQYCLKDQLNYLNVNRKDVICLSPTNRTNIDYIFDTTADLSKADDKYGIRNIEVITCDSREEEAQVISLIIENEGYENISLYVFDELLAARVTCFISGKYSSYITLLLYTIEVLISNWDSIALLSLLKHRLVTFGYTKKEYTQILFEFEIEVLRSFSTNGRISILNAINSHKKLRYKEDILIIINKLEAIFNHLLNVTNSDISDVLKTHLQCINLLTGIDFLMLDNEVGDFVRDFLYACKGIKMQYSLELYNQVLILFLKKEFCFTTSSLNKFSLHYNKIIILAGFYDMPNFQNLFLNTIAREKFNLFSIQEEHGYFLYILRSLFGANKVYITRLLSKKNPILLQRLKILSHRSKCPYLDWLRILNTPENFSPCTQPMPKPQAKIRERAIRVMSCSAVEKLIRNPYSFYVEHILNLRQLRDLNFKPSILEFGTMVHNILEKYLRDGKSPMWIAKEIFFANRFNFSKMWWVKLKNMIQSFVEFNKTRSTQIELEKRFCYPLTFSSTSILETTSKLQEIFLTGRSDRIEYLPDGQIEIIDYKIGLPPSNEEVISGFFPQLILQALGIKYFTRREVTGLSYWKLDYDKVKVVSLKYCKQQINEFQEKLSIFLFNYLKETTPFIASPYFDKFFKFDSYKQLERVWEWM
ncbi:MAG: PD-(D/E)XK nuclease family protein [Wolbachia endosymbiont of Meromenopon meropis]|nr:PD-(D/E)XK nuclease family protein [Wolbachia endosymbiont of Meromenopon meropis]